MAIRLGKIGYLNVLPIYHPLETGLIDNDFEFVSGPPSHLNRLMDAGELDISAASSIEFARHHEKYFLVPDIAIGSKGPVQSVLLLSQVPVKELGGKTILVSSQTHTSHALLQVLLKEMWKVSVEFVTGDATSVLESGDRPDAILAIGDEALNLRYHPDYPCRTDLGEAWRDMTGLPFIFGVWIVQKEQVLKDKKKTLEGCRQLVAGKQWGNAHMQIMCTLASEDSCLNKTEMCSYFDGLVYDFENKEQQGLQLFYEYLVKYRIIEKAPEPTFLTK